jgi:hypothetical protein
VRSSLVYMEVVDFATLPSPDASTSAGLQGYLDTGLVMWWTKKHGIMGSEKLSVADRALVGTNIWRSVEGINMLFGKVRGFNSGCAAIRLSPSFFLGEVPMCVPVCVHMCIHVSHMGHVYVCACVHAWVHGRVCV